MNEHVMTIVSAAVEERFWSQLTDSYKLASDELPEGLIYTHLMQDDRDPSRWIIMTLWESADILEKMRRATDVPMAILLFRAVHAEPTVAVYTVVSSHAS